MKRKISKLCLRLIRCWKSLLKIKNKTRDLSQVNYLLTIYLITVMSPNNKILLRVRQILLLKQTHNLFTNVNRLWQSLCLRKSILMIPILFHLAAAQNGSLKQLIKTKWTILLRNLPSLKIRDQLLQQLRASINLLQFYTTGLKR